MSATHCAVPTRAKIWTAPAAQDCLQQAARAELIEQSHLRCAALGLSRVQRPDFEPMMRSDLTVARDRNQRLSTHAAPVMELLFEQIVNSDSMIVLTDATGTILHSVGDDDFLDRARKVALSPGVNWAEQSKGTNAIGTALFEESPTLVHGGEHYMHVNGFLTCSAVPIFDPRGSILGVLDVTGDQRSYHRHTMGLVRMSARMIENHWLADDFGNRLRLHFHSRADCIGTLLEGIVVVAADGRILGANRSALDQLGQSSAALRMQSLTSLFGTTPVGVFDHFRAPLAVPMRVSLADGRQFHICARFDASVRSMMAGLGFDAGDASPAAHGSTQATLPGPSLLPQAGACRPPSALAGEAPQSARLSGLRYLETGDAQIETVVHKVQRILNRDIPLLILGETGTGKELLARAVHQDSNRARQPFVAVNCASIPESLIEAELFGYEDGAFTGARRKGATGRIVQAHGGTLFLDEIGDMPLALQARLLRVLQERCVTPLGSQKSIAVDIALVAATHRDLRRLIEAGGFRDDLYYRLNGLVVRLPALRERSDLEVVARRILHVECPGERPEIAAEVMSLFKRYSWPGNIRQLTNVLRTAAVMATGEPWITELHLSDDFLEDVQRLSGPRIAPAAAPAPPPPAVDATPETAAPALQERPAAPGDVRPLTCASPDDAPARTLGEAGIEMMRDALAAAGGNISVASKRLGISRNTIYRKLRWSKSN